MPEEGQKERPILTSLFNACFFVGAIVAAGITFGTQGIESDWSWRIPSLLQMGPSLLQVFLVFLLPESPRWLISKGREEEWSEQDQKGRGKAINCITISIKCARPVARLCSRLTVNPSGDAPVELATQPLVELL